MTEEEVRKDAEAKLKRMGYKKAKIVDVKDKKKVRMAEKGWGKEAAKHLEEAVGRAEKHVWEVTAEVSLK